MDMSVEEPEKDLKDILPPADPVPFVEWYATLTDGNNLKAKARLESGMAIQLISKATKAISDEATSKSLVAVFEDPAYVENPVMRAHKFEMAFSKVLKAAFKEFGFTAGVDCKKALRQLDLEKYEDEGVKAAMETFQETYKMIEEHRGEAQPPKKEEASEPA